MAQNDVELRILSIFHYILAGFTALVALFPGIYIIIGLVLIIAPNKMAQNGPPPPQFLGWIMVIMGAIVIVIGWTIAALMFTAGRCLARRKHHTFCLVVAGIECLMMPFGTILGVFTLVTLLKEPVKHLFEGTSSPIAGN